MEALMSIPEVADLYRTSRASVYGLIHKGLLKTTDISAGDGKRTRTRVFRKSAEELLDKRRNK